VPTVQLPNNWRPRGYQRDSWLALERGVLRAYLCWHRRAGKDDVPLHWTACSAMQRKGNYWHMLPQASQARKAIWEAVNPHTGRRRIDEAFPAPLRARTRDNEMAITFKNGSTWQVVGSDNFDALVGSTPIGLTFSEYPLANPRAWALMRPMLLENGGWAIFNGTPRGRNHAHALFQAHRNDPSWFCQELGADQTGVFTPDQLEQERRDLIAEYGHQLGENMFQQEYMVSWDAAIIGAFYGQEMTAMERAGRIAIVEAEPGIPVHTSWDLGMDDSTVIWFWQVCAGQIRVLDVYDNAGHGLPHYADIVADRYRQFDWTRGDDYVPHDSKVRELGTGRTRLETMVHLGLRPRVVADHAVIDGINALRQTLPRVWMSERCRAAAEALKQYRAKWDDTTRTLSRAPLHDWTSHYADALRYMAMAWRELRAEPARAPGRQIGVGRANTATIEDLWRDAPSGSGRI
jgi:phage terminase large subunit